MTNKNIPQETQTVDPNNKRVKVGRKVDDVAKTAFFEVVEYLKIHVDDIDFEVTNIIQNHSSEVSGSAIFMSTTKGYVDILMKRATGNDLSVEQCINDPILRTIQNKLIAKCRLLNIPALDAVFRDGVYTKKIHLC